jgi:hypothetical protein
MHGGEIMRFTGMLLQINLASGEWHRDNGGRMLHHHLA